MVWAIHCACQMLRPRRENRCAVSCTMGTMVQSKRLSADTTDCLEYPCAHRAAWHPGHGYPSDGPLVSDDLSEQRTGADKPSGFACLHLDVKEVHGPTVQKGLLFSNISENANSQSWRIFPTDTTSLPLANFAELHICTIYATTRSKILLPALHMSMRKGDLFLARETLVVDQDPTIQREWSLSPAPF